MNLAPIDRLSFLACVTGLTLLAIAFAAMIVGAARPEWLPMAISAIAGFELFLALDARRRVGRG